MYAFTALSETLFCGVDKYSGRSVCSKTAGETRKGVSEGAEVASGVSRHNAEIAILYSNGGERCRQCLVQHEQRY